MTQTKQNSLRGYLVDAILFFSYMVFSISWLAGSKFTPQIMEHFKLSGLPASVTNSITISKIIGNFLAAWFLMKFGVKKGIAFSGLLITAVGLGAFATSFPLYIVSRFVMGFGGALIVVYFGPIVMHYFEPEKRPLMNGINGVANCTGNVLALLLVGPVLNVTGSWQGGILFFAGISLLLLVLWLIIGEDFKIEVKKKDSDTTSNYSYAQAIKDPYNYKLAFGYSGWLTLYIVILNIFPLSDTVAVDATKLAMLMGIGGIVATPFGIMLTKKVTKKLPTIRICGMIGPILALATVLSSSSSVAMICAFLLGFIIFLPMTLYFTLPQLLSGMTPGKISIVMAMFWGITYVIETIFYTIITKVVNLYGFQMGLYLSICLSLTMLIGGFLLPEPSKVNCV